MGRTGRTRGARRRRHSFAERSSLCSGPCSGRFVRANARDPSSNPATWGNRGTERGRGMLEGTRLEGGGTAWDFPSGGISAAGGGGRRGAGVFVPSRVPGVVVCRVPRYQRLSPIGGLGSSLFLWGHLPPHSLPREPFCKCSFGAWKEGVLTPWETAGMLLAFPGLTFHVWGMGT